MLNQSYLIFSLRETASLGLKVAEALGGSLSEVEELSFSDGEFKVSPKVEIQNRNIYLIQSLYQDSMTSLDTKICHLLFFISTLKNAGARHITAVIPYLAYARQDSREGQNEALAHQHLAVLLEAAGVHTVITLDVHNISAFQNAHRCQTFNLEADHLFIDYLRTHYPAEPFVVVSPDAGGIKRAKKFLNKLEIRSSNSIPFATVDKSRTGAGIVVHQLLGTVEHKTVILVDDMISTGATIFQAARLCRESGAKRVIAVASHGLFCGKALDLFSGNEVDQVLVTDTVRRGIGLPELRRDKFKVISVVPLIAGMIKKREEKWIHDRSAAA
jgi:ribose-phosphate pyrophosphokinase